MEIWKDVIGYEGQYQVSNKGNVRSLDRVIDVDREGARKQKMFSKHRMLRMQKLNGYYRVRLNNGKKIKRYFVHRLVAEAFLENKNNFPIVNHKDENRSNNCVENLEWCTYSYNVRYGSSLVKLTKFHPNCKKVGKYDESGNLLETYISISDACNKNCCCHSNLSKALNRGKKYRGFYWRFIYD